MHPKSHLNNTQTVSIFVQVAICRITIHRVLSLRASSIVQIIFSFWSFEISESILKNHLDSFSNQLNIHVFGPILIILVFASTTLLKVAKLQLFSLAQFCQIYGVTEEA